MMLYLAETRLKHCLQLKRHHPEAEAMPEAVEEETNAVVLREVVEHSVEVCSKEEEGALNALATLQDIWVEADGLVAGLQLRKTRPCGSISCSFSRRKASSLRVYSFSRRSDARRMRTP